MCVCVCISMFCGHIYAFTMLRYPTLHTDRERPLTACLCVCVRGVWWVGVWCVLWCVCVCVYVCVCVGVWLCVVFFVFIVFECVLMRLCADLLIPPQCLPLTAR